MRQFLNNPWVVFGLCGVAIVVLYLNANDGAVQKVVPQQVISGDLPLDPEVDSSTMEKPTIDLARMDWPTTVTRDPFAPMSQPGNNTRRMGNPTGRRTFDSRPITAEVVSSPPRLQLNAVALDPEPKVAMINRKLVTEGDRIEGMRVSRIESDGVWLNGPSGRHHLVFEGTRGKGQTGKEKDEVSTRVPKPSHEVGRSRRDTSLIDGRDCTRSSTCS